MDDEIKEKIKAYYIGNDIDKVLNDITNLQQENDKLLKENIVIKDVKYTVDEAIYKSRCEKANDKIQYIIDYGFDYDGFNTVESLKSLIDMLVDYARESKNILQNGSDDNDK